MTQTQIPAPAETHAQRPPTCGTAFRSLLRSEARLLAREPAALIWTTLLPVVACVVLAVVPATRRPSESLGGFSVSQLYTPVLVMLATSMLAIQFMPVIISQYRTDGVLRRLRTTPAQPAWLLAAIGTVVAGAGLLVALVLTLLPWVLGAGRPANVVAFTLVTVLAGLSFLSVGALLSALASSPRIAGGIAAVVTMVLWFFSGLWVPRTIFPTWLERLADVVSTGVASRAMVTAQAGGWPAWPTYLVLGVWIVVPAVVAVRTFRWE